MDEASTKILEFLRWNFQWGLIVIIAFSLIEGVVLSIVWWRGGRAYDWKSTALSLFDFVAREYVLLVLLPMIILAWPFLWVYQFRLISLNYEHWWHWAYAFLVIEFLYYWYHRGSHRIRWFWCTHSVHHSPEQLNLSAAGRMGWTGHISGIPLFYLPAPLMGVAPDLVLAFISANLFYQFWIHNTWVPRLGPFEWVLNTPSSHRVHHGRNAEYVDRNYGGVLIIFDRLFGTYVAENKNIPIDYGIGERPRIHSVLDVEFGRWRALFGDLRAAGTVSEFLNLLLRPPR